MDDYRKYQQSRSGNGGNGYDGRSQAPPPRGASSRGGPEPYDRYGGGPSPNSSYRSRSPNPPSYRSDPDADRRELLGDRPPQPSGYSDNRYASQGNRYYPGEDYDAYGDTRFAQQQEEEEVDNLKQQIKFTKQDTLASTRNALNKIYEAENMGANTMNKLADQSKQLGRIDGHIDDAQAHADLASKKTSELKQLQRSMFIPVFKNPFSKSREVKEIQAFKQDHQNQAKSRDEVRRYEYESQQRVANLERQQKYQPERSGNSRSERERYQFEADAEDDAIEDEIDSNLDELSSATGRLKNLAMTMNQELSAQNKMLDRTQRKVDPLIEGVATTTYRVNNIR